MYSRQNRSRPAETGIDIPRDYSGNAFMPFPEPTPPPSRRRRDERPGEQDERRPSPKPPEPDVRDCDDSRKSPGCDDGCDCSESCECDGKGKCDRNDCHDAKDECRDVEICHPPRLGGLSSLFGGELGLEELLLLGVIFLIFADSDHRDNELLICLLLILFI